MVSSVGTDDESRQQHLNEFGRVAVLRIHQQMMHSDRQAVDQKEDEGQAPHGVAVEPSAGRARHHGVKRDVGRDQPEIHDRMQRPGEQRARKPDIDGLDKSERRRDDLERQFDRDADGGPQPHHGVGDGRKHRERNRPPGFSRFHALIATSIRMHQTHEPATTSTRPM